MRLLVLSSITMIAFASNSILNRVGLASGDMDAISFAVVRLIAGALMLGLLLWMRDHRLTLGGANRSVGVISLLVYLFGFSLAYQSLDAGLGALILFGMVQITMFAGALVAGERPSLRKWMGAGLAFGGLVWLLWPGQGTAANLSHAALMALAGIGWGVYSLNGRGQTDALGATATNFLLAAPFGCLALFAEGANLLSATGFGVSMAILSGAVTSGMGYALWYTVLPRLSGATAAIAQLTVPVIAMAGGALLLSEDLTMRLVWAAILVLGGVFIAVTSRR